MGRPRCRSRHPNTLLLGAEFLYFMTTTAIVSALFEEQQGLVQMLGNARCVTRAGRNFWCGEWHGQAVVLALSGIAKVAAATTATVLIEAFKVDQIVFTGVAGGLGPGVNVGDVVIANAFVQHDLDVSPLFPRYQLPLYGRSVLDCDVALTAVLLRSVCSVFTKARGEMHGISIEKSAKVHQGLIASGDRFVCGKAESLALQAAMRGAGFQPLAVEMEGAAVAQVCFDYGVPFAAVRIISDRADGQAHINFQKFVTEIASGYALAIMDEFMRSLQNK